jgi:hypothetical protein
MRPSWRLNRNWPDYILRLKKEPLNLKKMCTRSYMVNKNCDVSCIHFNIDILLLILLRYSSIYLI